MNLRRDLLTALQQALDSAPVVAILGPRQVGKTTLALDVIQSVSASHVYLDRNSFLCFGAWSMRRAGRG